VSARLQPKPGLITAAAGSLVHAGKLGRELGRQLDVLRSIGPRQSWTSRHQRAGAVSLAVEGRRRVYREIWADAAAAQGAEPVDLGRGFLLLRQGGRETTVWNNQVKLDDPVALRLAADKPLAHQLLSTAGLPVPGHLEFHYRDLSSAFRFLSESPGPCVVKPARDTGGGAGVTCGVVSPDDLVRARLRAARWDDQLVVERQATGDEYRLLLLDGELLGAVKRSPPRVVPDGRQSVGALIAAENARRLASSGRSGLWLIQPDLDCVLTLRRSGLTLGSVPPPGPPITVKTAANENGPADNETMPSIGEALVREAARAAAALGVRLAGVEVIAADPQRGVAGGGGVIVEVNGTPGLHYHYQVADLHRATPVAVPILSVLLDSGVHHDGWDESATRRRHPTTPGARE